jgi:hypothetical protein
LYTGNPEPDTSGIWYVFRFDEHQAVAELAALVCGGPQPTLVHHGGPYWVAVVKPGVPGVSRETGGGR